MNKKIFFLLFFLLFLNNLGFTSAFDCILEETQPCTMPDGCDGTQTCDRGAWGECIKDDPNCPYSPFFTLSWTCSTCYPLAFPHFTSIIGEQSYRTAKVRVQCNDGPCEGVNAILEYCQGASCSNYVPIPSSSSGNPLYISSGSSTISLTTISSGSYKYAIWSSTIKKGSTAVEGQQYNLRLRVTSTNAAQATVTGKYFYMNYLPLVVLNQPTGTQTIEIGQNLLIDWTTIDPDGDLSGIDSAVYYAPKDSCDTLHQTLIHSSTGNPGTYQYNWPVNIAPGEYCLYVHVGDDYESFAMTEKVYLTVIVPPCSGSLVSFILEPADNSGVYEGQSFNFNAKTTSPTLPYCSTDLTFEYDKGSGLGIFEQLPGSDFVLDPPEDNFFESTEATTQNVVLTNYTVEKLISVKCNKKGSYDLRFSTNPPASLSNVISVDCLENTPPVGNITSPIKASVYGSSFTVSWDAFDAEENDSLNYYVSWDGPTSGSDSVSADSYKIESLQQGDYTITLQADDGVNPPVEIGTMILIVVETQQENTLSIKSLTVVPEAIYSDGSIDVALTVRNDSTETVDFDVSFFNDNFSINPLTQNQSNVQPNSKASFFFHQNFSGLAEGNYEIRILISDSLGNSLESFAYFAVTAKPHEEDAQGMPETNSFFILLIIFSVLFLIKRNK